MVDGKIQIRINEILDRLPCGSKDQAKTEIMELLKEIKQEALDALTGTPSTFNPYSDPFFVMFEFWFKKNFGE